jgi:DNA gyrase subunit A
MRHGRATGGQKGYNVTEKTGEVVGVISVTDSDEIMCITSQGKSLRVPADSISEQGRAAQGVRVLDINQPDMVIGIDKIANDEDSEES